MVSPNIIFASGIVKILEMEWIKQVNLDSYVILVAIGLCESYVSTIFFPENFNLMAQNNSQCQKKSGYFGLINSQI